MVSSKKDITTLLEANRESISRFGAASLGLFGSFARDEANQQSDIDLIVEFRQGAKNYDNFINLAYYLEDLLGRRVELVTSTSLSKYLKPIIDNTIEHVTIS